MHLRLFLILLFCTSVATAQYKAFKQDAVADSLLVVQLLHRHNNPPVRESDFDNVTWTGGKVFYSPDNLLRIAQVYGHLGSAGFTSTVFSFMYNDSLVEDVLPTNFQLGKAPLQYIFLLTPNHYLLVSGAEDLFDQTETHTAAVVFFSEDRLATSVFTSEADNIQQEDELIFATLNSVHNTCPAPYFMYDTAKQELRYLVLREERSNTGERLINTAVAGAYRFMDNGVFVQSSDTSWYCPSLSQLTDTLATRSALIGKYKITTVVTSEVEDINGGLFEMYKHHHRVGDTSLSCNSLYKDALEKFPAAKLQPNGALVLMTRDLYTYYAPGDCGSCEHVDNTFYYILNGKAVQVLTIRNNTGSGSVEYEFLDAKNKVNRGEFAIEQNTRGLEATITWSRANTVTVRVTTSETGVKTKSVYHSFLIGFANGRPYVKKVK